MPVHTLKLPRNDEARHGRNSNGRLTNSPDSGVPVRALNSGFNRHDFRVRLLRIGSDAVHSFGFRFL